MPLYEYECFVCRLRFEKIQKTSAEPIKACPECGGAVRRLLGVPALQFKGAGWYVTDYGKGTGGTPGERKADPAASSETTPPKTDSGTSKKDATSSSTAAKDASAS